MKVLSLFDGMACGMLAFKSIGIEVESYDAYEIDKYAIKTATHNFPIIKHNGDVFTADFTKHKGVDFVVGGSPCTYWSIAQKNNRETEPSGMGWELFSQYVRAIEEAEPKYFIYENNKSMSASIRASIDKAFGFSAVYINSALVSAQNRQRLYWVGKRNADGTYSKVDVKQPKGRGILLRDVLETCTDIKCLSDREIDYMVRNSTGNYSDRWSYCQKPSESEKSLCITANIHKGVPYNVVAEPIRIGSNTGLYEIPTDKPMYEVKDGFITIKGKQYPIKLADGYYIIRKLTVTECKRLQTVPEWYEFPVSNCQAYKMLGNGWTVEVIAHLIKAALTNRTAREEMEQISIFDVV